MAPSARLLVAVAALLLAMVACASAQTTPRDAAVLTVQFDNRRRSTTRGNANRRILETLATKVFLVPVSQVKLVSGLDQSGLLSSQSTVVYSAVGPTTNGRTVLQNCQQNTRSGFISDSTLENSIEEATDTWWPGDKVEVEKAECTQG